MSFIYPAGDAQVTVNYGLATWGMDEVLAENMILIDNAIFGASVVKVNSSVIHNPNFNDTTPAAPAGKTNVSWQVDGSGNVSAYLTASSSWSSLTDPTANLSLNMGQFSSGFNYTSGTALVLTKVSSVNQPGDLSTYLGTITGGASNGLAGQMVSIAGFTHAGNNGIFLVHASTATSLTVINDTQLASVEIHAGTATLVGAMLYSNTTPATVTAHSNPPALVFSGFAWNAPGVSDPDLWTIEPLITGPSNAAVSTLTLTHIGDIATVGSLVILDRNSFPSFSLNGPSLTSTYAPLFTISGTAGSDANPVNLQATLSPTVFRKFS